MSQQFDATMSALADPTRRAIIEFLVNGESRITDIAKQFPISLNSVSKHIRVIERSGLIKRRTVGREHFLAFDPAPLTAAERWMRQQHEVWKFRLDALESALREKGDKK